MNPTVENTDEVIAEVGEHLDVGAAGEVLSRPVVRDQRRRGRRIAGQRGLDARAVVQAEIPVRADIER